VSLLIDAEIKDKKMGTYIENKEDGKFNRY
jgi:hypothetical protein